MLILDTVFIRYVKLTAKRHKCLTFAKTATVAHIRETKIIEPFTKVEMGLLPKMELTYPFSDMRSEIMKPTIIGLRMDGVKKAKSVTKGITKESFLMKFIH
jgi:hypothetical protein